MESSFTINGITCNNCVNKIGELVSSLPGVSNVSVDKDSGNVNVTGKGKITQLQMIDLLKDYPKYSVAFSATEDSSKNKSFKPLILVISFIILLVVLSQINNGIFDIMQSMRFFMGGFFVSFSFFKFLDLEGFASAYQNYDLIAAKFKTWGYVYPFVELCLGMSYILNYNPFITNIITLVVMGISSIGVIKAVTNKREIQCACLGTGFNLPMTTVTIIEDLGMVIMAGIMIIVGL